MKISKMITCVLLVLLWGCTTDKNITHNATVVFTIGEVTLTDQAGDKATIKQKDVLSKGGTLVTGVDSQCTVQVGDTALFKVLENSTLQVERLFDNGVNTLYLKKGKVLSKVRKLQKNNEYNIKTETSLAAVRGTTFSVSYHPGRNIVAVSRGKVEVMRFEDDTQEMAGQGEAIVVSDSVKLRDISEIEELELNKIEHVDFIRSTTVITGDKGKQLEKSLMKKDEEVNKKIEELRENQPPKTLGEIRERYNRIDEITLYSGKVYRGVILSRGASFKILTTSGTVTVPKNTIKRTRIVN